MDALKIKTLEEDNLFLRGQVQLLQARNAQLEERIAQLTAFIPSSSQPYGNTAYSLPHSAIAPPLTAASNTTSFSSSSVAAIGVPPPRHLDSSAEPTSIASGSSSRSLYHRPSLDTTTTNMEGPSHQQQHQPSTNSTTPSYDPPTPRPTPVRMRPVSGVPSSSAIRLSAVPPSLHRARSKTIAGGVSLPGLAAIARTNSLPPSSVVTSITTRGNAPRLTRPQILRKIFLLATNTELPSYDPFFQDATTNAWNKSVRVIKALCLVSKEWHASAVPLLYSKIRLRRIPQLSCLVSALEYRLSNKPAWTGKSYGSYTTHLDLSFYIPPEWNNLYADDVRRLIACVPNLQSYRSRPMLPILAPRPVPTPIIVCLADTRNELLNELEFSEQEGPQMPDLIRLLQSCTYLEKLTLGKYVFDGGLHSNIAVLRLPSLKSLEVKVTSRLTPGSFASLPSPHLLSEASKWDLPDLESLTLILYDDNRVPSSALNPFLNIHGHKLRQMTIRNADPIMQAPKLQISGILSRCPNLEEVAVVASTTAPLILARPHLHLQRVRFLGTAPGSRRDGGDLGHLLALAMDNSDGRRKFPNLREVLIQGEEDEVDSAQLVRMWQDAVGPNIRVATVDYNGVKKISDPSMMAATLGMGGVPLPRSLWSRMGGDEDEDDDEWLPDEEGEDSDEEEEMYFLATMEEDGDGSDEETVRDSRSGRGRDDDQFDHTTALLIFQDSISRKIKRRHS
ncbi:hypothetical protein CPB86DRAFT_727104, partial [Serendipita vermifera]